MLQLFHNNYRSEHYGPPHARTLLQRGLINLEFVLGCPHMAHNSRWLSSLLAPLGSQLAVASALRQAQHERAVFAMYRDAPIARDVADDHIRRYGLAAFGYSGHQVVHAADCDVCCGGALGCGSDEKHLSGHPEDLWFGCFYHLGWQLFLDGNGDASLSDFVARSEERRVLQFVEMQSLRDLFLIDGGDAEPVQFAIQLHSALRDAFIEVLVLEPGAHLGAGARDLQEAE